MSSSVIRGGLVAVAIAYLILGALSFLPDRFWLFETVSNLRADLVWLGLLIAALLLLVRLPITALVIALTAAGHCFLALHPSDPVANIATKAPNLRVMTINIGADKHRDDRRLIETIVEARPDILVLIGDLPATRKMIVSATGFLPYHAETGVDIRGISIDSRLPLANPTVESPDSVTPILTAQIAVPTGTGVTMILFIAAHPLAPTQEWSARHRLKGFDALGKWAGSIDVPVVLAGDLNVTPHSEYFGRLARTGDLFDTARGASPPATWLTTIPGIGLRIDHVLVSPDIEVAHRTVSHYFGSAHRALTVDLVIPSAE